MPNGIGKHLPRQARPSPGTKAAAIVTLSTNTNTTPSEIAKTLDCSISLITHTLKRYGLNQQVIESFKQQRAEILAGKQAELMSSLSSEDIQKASPYQKVGMFGILYDKERLERDLSTSNLASIHADIAALRKQESTSEKGENE